MLAELRGEADLVLDTTDLNVHQLRAKIDAAFGATDRPALQATVLSFGFKYGLPLDADLVLDCRFLPNPHWVEELRPFSGLDEPVARFVLEQPDAQHFLDEVVDLLTWQVPAFAKEGKAYLSIAIGCTGGRHRSVAITEEIARRLPFKVAVFHRDIDR